MLHLLEDYEALRCEYARESGWNDGDVPDESALKASLLLQEIGLPAVVYQSPVGETVEVARQRMLDSLQRPRPPVDVAATRKTAFMKVLVKAHRALLNVPQVGEVYDRQAERTQRSAKNLIMDTAVQVGEFSWPVMKPNISQHPVERRHWPVLLEALQRAYRALDQAPLAGRVYEQAHSNMMTAAALEIEKAARSVGMEVSNAILPGLSPLVMEDEPERGRER